MCFVLRSESYDCRSCLQEHEPSLVENGIWGLLTYKSTQKDDTASGMSANSPVTASCSSYSTYPWSVMISPFSRVLQSSVAAATREKIILGMTASLCCSTHQSVGCFLEPSSCGCSEAQRIARPTPDDLQPRARQQGSLNVEFEMN